MRRAIFDGSVDPRKDLYELNLEQEIDFDRSVRVWFEWLATHHDVYRLGKTEEAVARIFDEAQRALKREPAAGVIGPAEWSDSFLAAGYCQCLWKRLGSAFSGWVHRHEEGKLIRAYLSQNSPTDDNQYAARLAVWCTDDKWPTDWSTWRADHSAVHDQAPLFAWANAWSNAPCAYWKAPAGTPVTVEGDDTQVLMISETLDAATPYEWSVYVRSIFPNAVLIAEPGGTTHAGAFFGYAPDCVFERIFAFLATGELPPRQAGDDADLVCEPLPPPSPTADRSGHASRAFGPFTEPSVGI
jgi:hypothetical protein